MRNSTVGKPDPYHVVIFYQFLCATSFNNSAIHLTTGTGRPNVASIMSLLMNTAWLVNQIDFFITISLIYFVWIIEFSELVDYCKQNVIYRYTCICP